MTFIFIRLVASKAANSQNIQIQEKLNKSEIKQKIILKLALNSHCNIYIACAYTSQILWKGLGLHIKFAGIIPVSFKFIVHFSLDYCKSLSCNLSNSNIH